MSDKPLTPEEMTEAANTFFPLFNVVLNRMPAGSSTEDTLKVMENVAKLAQKNRRKKKDERFGFNKEEKDD